MGTSLASAKWKEVNRKPYKINKFIPKTKADPKERPAYNSHSRIMLLFNWIVIIWKGRGVRLKLDVQGQGGGVILDVAGQGTPILDNFHGCHMCIVPYNYFCFIII